MSVGHSESDAREPELETVDIYAFGHRFADLTPGLGEHLTTLEREGAIYAHFADMETRQDDGTVQFRYFRIAFQPREIFEYVEAALAYQAFNSEADRLRLEGRQFPTMDEWLRACLEPLPNNVAERVTAYGGHLPAEAPGPAERDIRGCFASFYPDGLEALVCGQRHERYEELPGIASRDSLGLAMKILNNLDVSARHLRDRQRSRPAFAVENEYDLQDLAFAVLRGVFDDARREEWTPQRAGSAKRIDVVLPSINAVLETKFVRDPAHARRVADELRIDFECYHDHPNCRRFFALVWDPQRYIPDPAQFSADLSGLRQKGGHSFEVSVLVR